MPRRLTFTPYHETGTLKVFTKAEVLAAKPINIKTGKPITEEELTKDSYTGKDFDDELFIDMRTPAASATGITARRNRARCSRRQACVMSR